MLSTVDIPVASIQREAARHHDIDADRAVLVSAGGQVLGGALIDGTIGSSGASFSLIECWKVSDLIMPHWIGMVGKVEVEVVAVDAFIMEAIRATLDRFHADGARRIMASDCRRQGVLDAVSALAPLRWDTTTEGNRGGQHGG